LRLEELIVPETSRYVNKTLMDSGIRKDYDIIVVAIKRKEDKAQMSFNPSHLTEIEAGDIIIVLGDSANIKRFEDEL
jgi:voltage-gated potassium channel